ncbi:meiotic recombination protein SPO11-like [Physella acuta]|uniref:meiotic recombination protein SPO11-like n=1 Tax=Physella acuta TaxID=109671 RepID=UPI0027DC41B2|nr:meiotic recombination protein SPO11-like [Physella acuta]XP_059144135.1 meiotic recombination protein SPO11-like [Physella acuta]
MNSTLSKKQLLISEAEEEILVKIESICLDIINSLSQDEPPTLNYPRRSNWNELVFEETVGLDNNSADMPMTSVKFNKPRSVKKFATMLKILKIIYSLVQENRYCTKRDIFYQYPELYPCQSMIDKIIDDIASMLKVPRWELHILATSKGLVAGNLQFEDSEGTRFDCQHTLSGVQIAAHTKDMQNIQTQAKFVLVVEKDATFQKLMNCQFCQKVANSILITGKGFPDNATRLLLQDIYNIYQLPIFILVDGDPHGIEIMAVYKYGSMNQAFDNKNLAIPSIEWIGILPEDINRLHIPTAALSPLSEKDIQKCISLRSRPYFRQDESILAQIDILLQLKKKAEIQCLDAISPDYLCDVYLPSRFDLLLP